MSASLYQRISESKRTQYGTEAERVLRIIINQYSDRTHFIFEILQNAEDAGATYIRFSLERDRLLIYHNGREFNEADIEGICGVAKGTKEDGTRIGHFGIGFKSVYCYTERPLIYSGPYHFAIVSQLFPEEVEEKADLSKHETLFVLPFDKPEVSKEVAFDEIKEALLEKITAESILMLSSIEDIKINISGYQNSIEINKQRFPLDKYYSENVFSLSTQTTITRISTREQKFVDKDYLLFTDAAEKESVAVVYSIQGKELRPVKNSKIYAYFPTAKEAHQGFFIHAPFDTTPARDNFKEGAEYGKHNLKLIEKIGEVIWFSFVWMRDNHYLTANGLKNVFPIYAYDSRDVLYGIYLNSLKMAREEAIFPTTENEFKTIKELCIPQYGIIADTFDQNDLRRLLGKRNISWLAKEFTTDAYSALRSFIKQNYQVDEIDWKDLTLRMDAHFLEEKSIDWIGQLMSRIESYCIRRSSTDTHYFNPNRIPFLRDSSGKHFFARDNKGKLQAYLNNPKIAVRRIDNRYLQNASIYAFLSNALQIPLYNIEQEAIDTILPKYADEYPAFTTDNPLQENIEDLSVIKDAINANPLICERVKEHYIVSDGTRWCKPSELYIPSNDTRKGYGLVKGLIPIHYLAEAYFNGPYYSLRLDEAFFAQIGCSAGIRVEETTRDAYLRAVRKYLGSQEALDIKNTIFTKTYLSKKMVWNFNYEGFPAVFNAMSLDKSLEIARFLNPNAMDFDIRGELVAADDQHFSGKNVSSMTVYSMLGLQLCYEKWVYIKKDDKPHAPAEVDREDLRPDYAFAKRLLNILPFKETKNALSEWINQEIPDKRDRELVKRFVANPEELIKAAKAMARSEAQAEAREQKASTIKDLIEQGDRKQKQTSTGRQNDFEVTAISSKAKERREKALDEQFAASMDNFVRFSRRLRFVSQKSNDEERRFLAQEYDGFCQMCLKRIVKWNGDYYFEAINIVGFDELPEKLERTNKYGWNSLCLCPTCAAEYRYCSKKISSMADQIEATEVIPGSEDAIVIDIEIPEGRKRSIRYSPRHFLALKEALKVFAEE